MSEVIELPSEVLQRMIKEMPATANCNTELHSLFDFFKVHNELVKDKNYNEDFIKYSDQAYLDGDKEWIVLYYNVMARIQRHQVNTRNGQVTLFLSNRNTEGWLEFLLRFRNESGGGITIGCIQRRPGEDCEFHS